MRHLVLARCLVACSSDDQTFMGPTRTFFIAADEVAWNYAPTGINMITNQPLIVVFKNNTAFPYSVHFHGLEYTKENEGAPYGSNAPSPGDSVPPGGTVAYHLDVPERAGPGPNDGSSVLWMYHSQVDEAGRRQLGPDGRGGRDRRRPGARGRHTDRCRPEIPVLFEVMDENASNYLDDNIKNVRQATGVALIPRTRSSRRAT